jgi:molybdate transport system substrate-binding protein
VFTTVLATAQVATLAIAVTTLPSSAIACDGLLVYAGAGFRPPIEEAAQAFAAREGFPVETTFAGSGCLLAQAELAGRGDVFIPGELHYLDQACQRKLASSTISLAYLTPTIVVARGNPLRVHRLEDLARTDLRVGLGDPKSVAVGIASEKWLAAELEPSTVSAVTRHVRTRALNVNELGAQLTLGAIDAAIVWDATLPIFPALERVPLESSREHRTVICAGALEMSLWPDETQRFLAFLTGPEGRAIFREHGYEPFVSGEEAPVE